MTAYRPFHLAFAVHDLELARVFYEEILGCPKGRKDRNWADYNLYGHQIVTHLDESQSKPVAIKNPVDGDQVPVPHFGVILTLRQFADLQNRLESHSGTIWVIKPRIRFQGHAGEQRTMFLLDPSGNALEFKAFADDSQLFAT